MKQYHTILLDIDGTLLDFQAAELNGIDEVMKQYKIAPSEELRQQYRSINDRLWKEYELGKISRDQIMGHRFSEFFERIGQPVDGDQAEKQYRERLNESAVLIDGAYEICRILSEKYALYVVTNGVSETQYRRMKKCGLTPFFRDIFVSEDAGSQKPQPEFFEYCFSRMPREDRRNMLIVGDSLSSDIKGGNLAGIDTCWYNPEKAPRDPAVKVDYEIEKLMELKDILL